MVEKQDDVPRSPVAAVTAVIDSTVFVSTILTGCGGVVGGFDEDWRRTKAQLARLEYSDYSQMKR